MSELNNIIKIIDIILYNAEINYRPTAFVDIYTKELCPGKLPRYQSLKILRKLEKNGCISNIFSVDSGYEWGSAMLDSENSHLLKLRPNTNKLISYKKELINKSDSHKISNKIEISVSKNQGIYKETEYGKLKYPIKGMRSNLVFILKKNPKIRINELCAIQGQNKSLLCKEIRTINIMFREKLDLDDDFIIHIPTGGYTLNDEKFNIIFNQP